MAIKIAMLGHKVVPSRRGGIETVLTNLAPALAKKGADITLYNRTSDSVENEYVGTVKDGKYEGVKLKKARTIKMRGFSAMISSYTAAIACAFGKYDIIHFHAEGPCAAMWIPKLFGKKCVATVHGLDWQREKWGSGLGSKYIHLGEKTLAKHADEVIVLSEGVRQYFKDTYGRETRVIPNGISVPDKLPAKEITEKWGLTKDSYICLCSRLTEEKGVHFLIEAYKNLKTDKKLVICGDTSDTDDYVAKLREMAKDNENIIFTGFVSGDTLTEIYSNAYIVCLPSTIEGMSLSLLEALAFGNAVVCSDIPENKDVCQEYGVTFKSGDAEDLAVKLQGLIDTPQRVNELKNTAGDFILEKYSWEKTTDLTYKLYEKLLNKKKGKSTK